jgi:hypothetical protein
MSRGVFPPGQDPAGAARFARLASRRPEAASIRLHVGRQIAIVVALLVAAGVLLAAMAWATAARAQRHAPASAPVERVV